MKTTINQILFTQNTKHDILANAIIPDFSWFQAPYPIFELKILEEYHGKSWLYFKGSALGVVRISFYHKSGYFNPYTSKNGGFTEWCVVE